MSLGSWAVVAGVAGVVAVAVAVPVVLADGDGPRRGGPAAEGALALGDLPVGAPPARGHLAGAELHRGAERLTLALDRGVAVDELVALEEGFLLSTSPDDEGQAWVHALDAAGARLAHWSVVADALETGLTASADGRLGAFVAGGKVVVVQEGGPTATGLALPDSDAGLPSVVLSVGGSDCAGGDADCVVLVKQWVPVDETASADSTWVLRPGRAPAPVDRGIPELDAVAADGSVAGTTEVVEDGDGSCAGVADATGSVRWTTCEHRLIAFSPDSSLVLAGTSAHFGSGDHELTVLDARTGAERLSLETAAQVGIFEMAWEDDGHLLAVVSDWAEDDAGEHVDPRWAVLRIGLDGSREYAVAPVPGEVGDYDGPLDLVR